MKTYSNASQPIPHIHFPWCPANDRTQPSCFFISLLSFHLPLCVPSPQGLQFNNATVPETEKEDRKAEKDITVADVLCKEVKEVLFFLNSLRSCTYSLRAET
jgi:hypothetical protein